jgi:lysophospholipase L1-like esterase
MRSLAFVVALSISAVGACASGQEPARWRFDFGPGVAGDGYTKVGADAKYSDDAGYGFVDPAKVEGVDRGGDDPLCNDFCTSGEPFAFAVKLPEGNYRIKATLGDPEGESTTTIHAEVRRLLANKIHLAKGEVGFYSAIVAVRTPRIAEGREVRLKPRERGEEWANWDDKLTLTFSGARPCVAALDIERDDRAPTLFLIGDSTMADQANPPWNSWGQMLPRFFDATIAVSSHAESGESIRGALGERRLEKLYSLVKPGDWVAMQFGHNDMKSTAPDALATYASDLERFVAEVRQRGATPILITSMERKNGIDRDTLAGYPDAVRTVAKKLDAPLIDLHAMSKRLYRAMGADLDAAFQDATHHQDYGSYELARCVVEGIRAATPELAKHLAQDAGTFDPDHPDAPDNWAAPTQPAAH